MTIFNFTSYELTTIAIAFSAFLLSFFSFLNSICRSYRDRPRLQFYISKAIITNKGDNKTFRMMQVILVNIGFRPIIITKFIALGKKSNYQMGLGDEPAAAYGRLEQKFPTLLEPGQSSIFHPLSIEAIANNYECPCDDKKFYDPFVYFGVSDSFNRFYAADAKRIRFMLGIEKNYKKPCFIEKIKAFFTKRSLIKSYKKLNP